MDAAANELRRVSGLSKVGIVQWGAPVGIVYAALWPEKVSHLVLCDMDCGIDADAAAIQPGLPGHGDLGGGVEPADVWPAVEAEAMSDIQIVRPVKRLALQDLAPLRDTFPDELAMNYANHIYCKVMVIEHGEGPDHDVEGAAPFRRDFIRAREVCVRRPDATERGASGRNRRRMRGGLIGSLAEFLR
jgi:pimeloyl-ACP methyl ester carboxylesterase